MRHDFDDGKYTVIADKGNLFALRNGKPWKRAAVGDQLVYAMLVEVDRLKSVLRQANVAAMADLMEEASRNLSALMDTPEAERLQVRHFLPDELDGSAIMLRDAYGIRAERGSQPPAPPTINP